MKSLPNVTLIAYDNTDAPERTVKSLRHCASLIQFAAVVLVCRVSPPNLNGEMIITTDQKGYAAAMNFEVNEIHKCVHSDHAIFVSHDGYIINPDAWRDEWLDYDFIGSPWPVQICPDNPNRRVGNTGFCLKSRAFMHYTAELGHQFDSQTPGDVFCCRTIADQLESLGIKFAPLEVALDFGWESYIDGYGNRSDAFGFHGLPKDVPSL